MLLTDEELKERMESPMNLMNRLHRAIHPDTHTLANVLPPSADEIIDNLEDKIKTGSIKSKALGLVSSALDELKNRLPEVQRPEKLAAIAESMAKVVNATEPKKDSAPIAQAQIIIYAPQIMTEENFNMVQLVD
jgi:hypothetical protein